LIWYLTLFGAFLAASRAFAQEPDPALEPEKAMKRIELHTHYFPDSWRTKAHKYEVYKDFTVLFPYRILNLLVELLGVFLVPLIMCLSLSRSAGMYRVSAIALN